MGKGKGKGKKPYGKGESSHERDSGAGDDLENASVMSIISDGETSYIGSDLEDNLEAGTSEAAVNASEDLFVDTLDSLTASGSAARERALTSMKKMLQMKCHALANIISKNYETLCDALTTCVKRGKGGECIIAAQCLSLLCIHLVNSVDCDVEHFYVSSLKPVLRQFLTDDSYRPEDRQAIAASFGLACYSCSEDPKV